MGRGKSFFVTAVDRIKRICLIITRIRRRTEILVIRIVWKTTAISRIKVGETNTF